MEQNLPVANLQKKLDAFARALGVMETLRQRCPWDAKQTNESIRQNTIEETYELCEALVKGDNREIQKECGDVLEQLLFYAKFGEEAGAFDMGDICNAMCDKLVFRHPHVYNSDGTLVGPEGPKDNGARVGGADDVSKLWEQVKQKEKDGNKTILSGVPSSLPALIKAYRIQDKAANAGFDWEKPQDVWAKVKEEISEFEAEASKAADAEGRFANADDREHFEQEFGDVLFSLVNAARLYHIKPDNALEKTNQKFTRRFNYVEAKAKEQSKTLNEMTLGEMDALWDEAKRMGL